MIKATVGRVVWFFGEMRDDENAFRQIRHPGREPLAAIVTHVWNDKMVNLVVFDMDGRSTGKTSVRLLQDSELPSGESFWAEWMPYQKGQAAKAEALEQELKRQ
jgi:hypothetical protein